MALLPPLNLGFFVEAAILIILLIIGLIIIVVIAKALLFFLPAAIIALVVWFLTGFSLFWAGVAFLIIAFISVLRRR